VMVAPCALCQVLFVLSHGSERTDVLQADVNRGWHGAGRRPNLAFHVCPGVQLPAGVISCSTGWQSLRDSPLPVTQLLDQRQSLPTDMLERVLICLGHCLAGHQKDRFSLGNGTASAVVSAVCRG